MQFRIQHYLSLVILALLASCSTSKSPLFGKRSPHEKYGDGINNAGLKQTQLGNAWFAAASKSLAQPQTVTLPYKETGYFASESPSASGYLFKAKRGEKIVVNVTTVPVTGFLFFAELWQPVAGKASLLTTMDTLTRQLKYTVEKDGPYILRLQPELLRSVEYTVTIITAPSLAFPVDRAGDPKIISMWGVGRDGGTRTHEGVDISARFRTPALAAADGYIRRVNEDNLGGKVVFLEDDNSGYSLYYAHLDSQTVRSGQRVRAGDVVGLVGKTGNAQNTVPHLHFGIYTGSGAIDPQAFIDNRHSEPKAVTASTLQLNKWLRTTAAVTIYEVPSTNSNKIGKTVMGDAVFIMAAVENWYKIQLPGGQQGFIISSLLTTKMLCKQKTTGEIRLLDAPDQNAAAKTIIAKGISIDVIGSYNNFYLVDHNNQKGWVTNNLLNLIK